MHLKVLLNRVCPLKSFVYDSITFDEGAETPTLLVRLRPRANSRALCSGCGRKAAGYDTLPERRFEFIPLWGVLVFFLYALRRVNCRRCGVKAELVPWAEGKRPVTTLYGWFLARWARRLSWSEVARVFHTSWHSVATSVEMAVEWGRHHMSLEGISSIGIDEICWGKGHLYATVVYQIDEGRKRLLWIGPHRTEETLREFFDWLGVERSARLKFVCSDMWAPYLEVIREKASKALNILDRFHIVSHLSKAIDKVRAEETKKLKAEGAEPVLTRSRWCLLKRVENLTERQMEKLQSLLKMNLKTVRAYLLKERLGQLWEYKSAHWAGNFLDAWCAQAMRSRIEPMKSVAKMLRRHRPLLLNWFRAKGQLSSGAVEGLNNKAKVVCRKAYGYGTFHALQTSLYHTLGDLPEPEFPHEFF